MGQAGRLDAAPDKGIVAVINDRFAVVEQSQLFQAFLRGRDKVLLMCFPYVRNHSDGWCDDRLQTFHFVRLGDAGFEDA